MSNFNRRKFIKQTTLASAATMLALESESAVGTAKPLFKISLAEWSLNKSLFAKKLDHLDFAVEARKHGFDAVEYVNQFFMDKAEDKAYLREMKYRADGEGVRSLLIMCDREGRLGHAEEKERIQTVENHKKWVEAARYLGCHSIRVNGYSGDGSSKKPDNFEESMKLVGDGLRRLCEFADPYGINIIIENHGGNSSNGKWLMGVMKVAAHPRAGTLPDFGNFQIYKDGDKVISYDSYQGVREMMPLARGVSVKPVVWDDKGNQSPLNYTKMLKIVLDAGFREYCGIEHGEKDREWESIKEIKQKLLETRDELATMYTP